MASTSRAVRSTLLVTISRLAASVQRWATGAPARLTTASHPSIACDASGVAPSQATGVRPGASSSGRRVMVTT